MFKAPHIQQKISQDGYAVVNLAEVLDIDSVRDKLSSFNLSEMEGDVIWNKMLSGDAERKALQGLLRTVFQPVLYTLAVEPQLMDGTVYMKQPGTAGTGFHQDWSCVDERSHRSWSLWIPLHDVDQQNGCFRVLPGSHRFFPVYRSASLNWPYANYEELFDQYALPLPLQKGQGIIFDHALIHGTTANQSAQPRQAIISGFRPKGTSLIQYYHAPESTELQVFNITPEFYRKHIPPNRPEPELAKLDVRFDFQLPEIQAEELEQKITLGLEVNLPPQGKLIVLQDEQLDRQLKQDGYVVAPLLDQEDIDFLTELYKSQYEPLLSSGLSNTFVDGNLQVNQLIDRTIRGYFQQKLNNRLGNFTLINATFMVKLPGEGGVIQPHMDWKLVDEPTLSSYAIWFPLHNIDHQNGAMQMAKGLHTFTRSPRGVGWNALSYDYRDIVDKVFHAHKSQINLTVGEAVIYDHRTLHGSGPNYSEKPRIAVNIMIAPENVPTYHYYKNVQGRIDQYRTDEAFFHQYTYGQAPPAAYLLKQNIPDLPPLSLSDLPLDRLPPTSSQTHPPAFRDSTAEQAITADGFITLPFLDASQVAHLNEVYQKLYAPEVQSDFATNFTENRYDLNAVILKELRKVCAPLIPEQFENHEIVYGSFMVKRPGSNGRVVPHLDWAFVDEAKERSFSIWIALQDIDLQNGGLTFVRGSHKHTSCIRGAGWYDIPAYDLTPILPELMETEAVPVNLKAGEAIIYDHRTLHFSENNLSTQPRIGINLSIIPTQTDCVHYFHSNEGKIELYEGGTEFFLGYVHGARPPERHLINSFWEHPLAPPVQKDTRHAE